MAIRFMEAFMLRMLSKSAANLTGFRGICERGLDEIRLEALVGQHAAI
jgi:hypothetical protein